MTTPEGTDYLTGFSLRETFDSFSRDLLHDAKKKNRSFSIVLIDLDLFKKFNDTHGHPFGDEVLKFTAENIRLSFNESSFTIFRYGGDEFVVVLPDKTPKETLRMVIQLRHNLIHRPFTHKNRTYKLTASCGVSGFPIDGQTITQLFEKADAALYYSKRRGRNHITLAYKLKASRLRNFLLITTGIFIIIVLFSMLYQSTLKGALYRTMLAARNIQITTTPKNLDVIILKRGTVFKGKIMGDTSNNILLDVHLDKGRASIWLQKSEIADIKYGRAPSKKLRN